MKNFIFICFTACLLVAPCVSFTQQTEQLTNQSVVEMIELGFDKQVVVEKINASACSFDTSIEALKLLKAQGVPSEVLAAMVKASKPTAAKAKTGIYALVDSIEVPILPTVFSGTKTNTLAAAFSYGIASAKVKSVVGGASSPNVLPAGSIEFVFYFDANKGDTFGQNDWWFRAATSPNEFALARFAVNEKKNYRELEVGSINIWAGSNTGVTDKLICPVEIEPRSEGVFVVRTIEPLEPGEYCFYYKGIIPQGGYNNQSAFDFSVQAPPTPVEVVAFVPEVGYVTRGQATDGLPLPEGLLYVGTLGGAKGVYLAPRDGASDEMAAWGEGSVPTREQLRKLVVSKMVANNPRYAFASNYYWSSTEADADKGWAIQAPSGDYHSLPKAVQAYVRQVWEY